MLRLSRTLLALSLLSLTNNCTFNPPYTAPSTPQYNVAPVPDTSSSEERAHWLSFPVATWPEALPHGTRFVATSAPELGDRRAPDDGLICEADLDRPSQLLEEGTVGTRVIAEHGMFLLPLTLDAIYRAQASR